MLFVLVSARTALIFYSSWEGAWPDPNVIQYHLRSLPEARKMTPLRRRASFLVREKKMVGKNRSST